MFLFCMLMNFLTNELTKIFTVIIREYLLHTLNNDNAFDMKLDDVFHDIITIDFMTNNYKINVITYCQ